jgi:hypothetical protein
MQMTTTPQVKDLRTFTDSFLLCRPARILYPAGSARKKLQNMLVQN